MKNTVKNSTYSLDLSQGELYWLAGSIGVNSLPVPDEAWRGHSLQDYAAATEKGCASLLARGLLCQSPGFGWQVDRLPSAIIQWLSRADFLLRLEYYTKNYPVQNKHIFTHNELGLSVEIEVDTAHFTLFETRAVLLEQINEWLTLPEVALNTGATFQLPQPEYFLPTVWKKPELFGQIYKTANISDKLRETEIWTQSLECFANLSKMQWDGYKFKKLDQFLICENNTHLWAGKAENEKVTFVSVRNNELTCTINQML